MPRPGPRPYECVRRAWHSDRHKPMRGSMIQQIFRLAYDTHSTATKKNREWQEKLPVVVLKAEEIMYSKANSEAEYESQETLWDRVNDAVNTIIRRDESTETGELLPPCIEAALNLGCSVVRASRSQRHSNPRSYLSPRMQDTVPAVSTVLDRTHDEGGPRLPPLHSSNQLNFVRATSAANSIIPVSDSNRCVIDNSHSTTSRSYPFSYESIAPDSIPACSDQFMTMEANKSASVYPLYYGNQYQADGSHLVSQVAEKTKSNAIFVGKPIGTSVAEHTEMGVLQNFLSCPSAEVRSKRAAQADFSNTHEKPTVPKCDLSLRLGLFSDHSVRLERSSAQETEDVGSSCSQERKKFGDFSHQTNKEFCFLPGRAINDPFQSHSVKWVSEGEGQNLEAIRKRKAPFNDNIEDGHFCWQPEFLPNQFTGRIERPVEITDSQADTEIASWDSVERLSPLLHSLLEFLLPNVLV